MTPTKLTNAPEGFEYYRVCDQEGVCHVVRGMQEVQRLLEKRPGPVSYTHLTLPTTPYV